jgi:hypothetical protein
MSDDIESTADNGTPPREYTDFCHPEPAHLNLSRYKDILKVSPGSIPVDMGCFNDFSDTHILRIFLQNFL